MSPAEGRRMGRAAPDIEECLLIHLFYRTLMLLNSLGTNCHSLNNRQTTFDHIKHFLYLPNATGFTTIDSLLGPVKETDEIRTHIVDGFLNKSANWSRVRALGKKI